MATWSSRQTVFLCIHHAPSRQSIHAWTVSILMNNSNPSPSSISHLICSFISQGLAKRPRPLARLLSTFLCSVIIVIRPFSHFGGQYAFLVLALKELVFSVQENLAQQLELTCLNILGALLGISFSTLGRYLASLAGPGTVTARAICATFLALISFIGEERRVHKAHSP